MTSKSWGYCNAEELRNKLQAVAMDTMSEIVFGQALTWDDKPKEYRLAAVDGILSFMSNVYTAMREGSGNNV